MNFCLSPILKYKLLKHMAFYIHVAKLLCHISGIHKIFVERRIPKIKSKFYIKFYI